MIEKHFQAADGLSLTDIYSAVCSSQIDQIAPLKKEFEELFERSAQSFPNAPDDEHAQLEMFSFICSLSFDIYIKKMLIEKLLDDWNNNTDK